MYSRTATQTIGFAAPPMEVAQALRLTPRETAIRGGLAIAARLLSAGSALAAVGCAGGVLSLIWPSSIFDVTEGVSWYTAMAMWAIGVIVFGLGAWRLYEFAEETDKALTTAMRNYNVFVQEWQDAALEAYKHHRGQVETRTYTESDLRVSQPKDFLATAVAVFVSSRRSGARTYTVEALKRGVFLDDGTGTTLLGRMTEAEALAFGQALSQARVITGRRHKAAGQLADVDLETFVEMVIPVIRKLHGRGDVYDGEVE